MTDVIECTAASNYWLDRSDGTVLAVTFGEDDIPDLTPVGRLLEWTDPVGVRVGSVDPSHRAAVDLVVDWVKAVAA